MRERVDGPNPGGKPPGIWIGTDKGLPPDPSILELARELVRIFRETVAARRQDVRPVDPAEKHEPSPGI